MPFINEQLKQWRERKPKNVALLTTVEIYHPTIGTHRIIYGFADKNLTLEAGAPRNASTEVTFRAVALDAPKPSQGDDTRIVLPITLPRVGSEIKEYVKLIKDFSAYTPIEIVWRQYLSTQTGSPVVYYYLYAKDVAFSSKSVTISATDENPMAKRVSRIATTGDFPGLIDL